MNTKHSSHSERLLRYFSHMVAAADPAFCLPPHLADMPKPAGRTWVVGAGKAAASMALALEQNWPRSHSALGGLVVTRYGYGLPCERIQVQEAAHPVPDAAGQAAAKRILQSVQALTADDLLIVLLSGGGSSLLALPAPGISLQDKQAINTALLKSGADIAKINCVRKHLSAIKGGQLAAAAWPAQVCTLGISDIPGDEPSVLASGPTVADPTTSGDARAILDAYQIPLPPAVRGWLNDPDSETIKPGDARFARNSFKWIATPGQALASVVDLAESEGVNVISLGADVEGESKSVAQAMAAQALTLAALPGSSVLLSGGETTVTVSNAGNAGKSAGRGGRGGRNTEFLLALAIALNGHPRIHAIACDTDGVDGTEDNAGALITPDTLSRLQAAGLDPAGCLLAHDSYTAFEAIGDLVRTGPTRTNVNDFRAIFISG